MKRPLLLLMSVLLLFAIGQSAWAFSDSGSDPNAKKIAALQEAGILSGEADGKFNPKGELTYAAGVSMLVKGLDISLARFTFIKAPMASDYYTNIKDGAWYSDAFIVAHINGLDIPKDVKPDQPMTREQFAHHLFRAMEANGSHAYIMMYAIVADEADIAPAYKDSVQKLLITHIAALDKENKFHPQANITRSEAAGWLHDAIQFVKKTPVLPPQTEEPNSPLSDLKLTSKSVNESVYEVTVSAKVPHPGYGIRIASIVFEGKQAVIYTEPVMPDPDKMYPQVISEVKAVTYVGAEYEPVLADSVSVPPVSGDVGSASAPAKAAASNGAGE